MTTSTVGRARAVARRIDRSTGAEWVARLGLAARAAFYLVLAYLALRIAFLPADATGPANAHGALATIADTIVGKVAIAVGAVGFIAFALARLSASVRDPDCSRWQRLVTALHGLVYLAIAYVPVSFLWGNRSTGSERQQQHRTAHLLGFPGGQVVVVGIGLAVVAACGWQIRSALCDDHREDLKLSGSSRRLRTVVQVVGAVGTAARALVFLPLGGFLIVAAIRYDPSEANGLDGELLVLSGHWWGTAVIVLAALGLLAFAAYSGFEARYRDTTKPA
jgi:hypothetical protein